MLKAGGTAQPRKDQGGVMMDFGASSEYAVPTFAFMI